MSRLLDWMAPRDFSFSWQSDTWNDGRREFQAPWRAQPRRAGPPRAARAPRILQVVEAAATGVGRHVLDLTEELLRRQCDVHLIYSTNRCDATFAERLARLPELGRSVVPMRSRPHPADARAALEVRRIAREQGPFDVIHCHSSKAGLVTRLAGLGLGARLVYTPHAIYTMSPELSAPMRGVYRAAEVTLSVLTDRIIAVSQDEHDECRRLGIHARRLSLVPNAVGRPDSLPRDVVRRQLGLADGEVAIGFVGRLSLQKGIDRMLEAFAQVPKDVPAKLVVVGDGELEAVARSQAEALGIGARVLWLGACAAQPLLLGFDLFAMPSRYEAASYSLLEAMAAGLPVIGTATGSARDLIIDGQNGFCVPAQDVDRFAACLKSLVVDHALRQAMSRTASTPRRELSGVGSMVDGIVSVYSGAWEPQAAWRGAEAGAS